MIIPTVRARIAQGTITCSREKAPLMALEMVGSPPLNRSRAPDTTAALKNTVMTVMANKMMMPPIHSIGSLPLLPPSSIPSVESQMGRPMARTTASELSAPRIGRTASSRSCCSTAHEALAVSIVRRNRPITETLPVIGDNSTEARSRSLGPA